MPFTDVIPVPRRNTNRHIALHNRLTPKPRIKLEVGSLFHAVKLVVFHLGKIVHSLFHDHMASSAGATPSTSMFQMETEIHGNIQQRFWLAMILIRQLTGFKLEGFVGG